MNFLGAPQAKGLKVHLRRGRLITKKMAKEQLPARFSALKAYLLLSLFVQILGTDTV